MSSYRFYTFGEKALLTASSEKRGKAGTDGTFSSPLRELGGGWPVLCRSRGCATKGGKNPIVPAGGPGNSGWPRQAGLAA